MRPVTNMLPTTTQPTRQMIFSDPSKLTYFARANAVRAGTFHTWGAFEGFNEAMPEHSVETSDNTRAAGALQTVGDLFGNIGRSLLGATPAQPVVQAVPEPSPMLPIAIGVGALLVGGFVVWKVMK